VIALLLAGAVAFFVLSLPLAKTTFGSALRRAAAVCFLLALLPSVIAGIFFAQRSTPVPAHGPMLLERGRNMLACLAGAALVSLGAYGILAARKRFGAPKKEPWEALFGRSSGKKRVIGAARTKATDREDGR
jgi:hypothetical protein